MGDLEPIAFPGGKRSKPSGTKVTVDRRELMRILELYGRKVAAGEWRDYAIAFLKDRAVFSVFGARPKCRSIVSKEHGAGAPPRRLRGGGGIRPRIEARR